MPDIRSNVFLNARNSRAMGTAKRLTILSAMVAATAIVAFAADKRSNPQQQNYPASGVSNLKTAHLKDAVPLLPDTTNPSGACMFRATDLKRFSEAIGDTNLQPVFIGAGLNNPHKETQGYEDEVSFAVYCPSPPVALTASTKSKADTHVPFLTKRETVQENGSSRVEHAHTNN